MGFLGHYKNFLALLTDIYESLGPIVFFYLILMVISGFLEGITIASLVPLLMAVGVSPESETTQGIGRLASSVLEGLGVEPTLYSLGLFVVFACFLSGGVYLLQAHFSFKLQSAYMFSWHQRLFRAVFGAHWPFFLQQQTGSIVNAATTEVSRIGGAFYQAASLITGIVHSLIYFSIAANLSSAATLGVLVGGALLFLSTRPIIRRAYDIGTGISRENESLQQSLIELVSGAKLLKATATESVAVSMVIRTAKNLRQLTYRNNFDVQIVKAIFDFGSAVLVASILIVGSSFLGIDPAVILVILAIFVRLMPKLTGMQQGIQSLTVSLSALKTLQKIHGIAKKQKEKLASAEKLPEQLKVGPFEIEMNNLAFSYGETRVLNQMTLSVPKGCIVALVGESGAGKTTIVDLVLRLVKARSGDIQFNKISIDKIPLGTLRPRVGYLSQDTILYNASVRDNLLWGNQGYNDQEIETVARSVGAWDFLQNMPGKLDAFVGDRGARLSGGERQRLGLVRAMLGNPGLLILDEATSALDAASEKQVSQAISRLRGQVTVLMIAHRLSSVRIADVIHVVKDGRIVESGNWDKLACPGTEFWKLWSLQQGSKGSL